MIYASFERNTFGHRIMDSAAQTAAFLTILHHAIREICPHGTYESLGGFNHRIAVCICIYFEHLPARLHSLHIKKSDLEKEQGREGEAEVETGAFDRLGRTKSDLHGDLHGDCIAISPT